MIAQLQNLQAFVAQHLADVVDWSRDVRPDPNRKTTGDHAFIVVKTPFNSYEMTVRSATLRPLGNMVELYAAPDDTVDELGQGETHHAGNRPAGDREVGVRLEGIGDDMHLLEAGSTRLGSGDERYGPVFAA